MTKKKIIFLSAFAVIITISGALIYNKKHVEKNIPAQDSPKQQNKSPEIVATKPDPLDNNIIGSSDPIEITFNKQLQNEGEFKVKIEPKIDFKIKLSSDRKTGIITFTKPLDLGMTYTIFIGPETKFDGVGNWGQEKIFHIHTIKYTGV